MPMWPDDQGNEAPIDETQVFDRAILNVHNAGEPVLDLRIFNGAPTLTDAGVLPTPAGLIGNYDFHDPTNTEVAEILRRIDAGTCSVWYYDGTLRSIIREDRVGPLYLRSQLDHPFHEHRELTALNQLFHNLRYRTPEGDTPAHLESLLRIEHPGHDAEPDPAMPLDSFRVYKRDDATTLPLPTSGPAETKGALLIALAAEGWHSIVPVGARRLHFTDVQRFADSVNYMAPMRLYRSLDYTAWIRTIALRFKAWEDGLTAANTGNTYDTTKEWWKSWIGRAWSLKPFTSDQNIFYDGNLQSSVARDANDVPDWFLGHMEEWLQKPNGVEDFRTALSQSVVQTRLDSFESFHIKNDGTPGDILSNGAQGLTQAEWTAFTTTHYNAAAGITGA